ncbi:UNVERIFIED_CONTAM: hypothetical protein FKN15_050464 [Acipenser sinensis]
MDYATLSALLEQLDSRREVEERRREESAYGAQYARCLVPQCSVHSVHAVSRCPLPCRRCSTPL